MEADECVRDFHNCTICICQLIIMAAISGADLLDLSSEIQNLERDQILTTALIFTCIELEHNEFDVKRKRGVYGF